ASRRSSTLSRGCTNSPRPRASDRSPSRGAISALKRRRRSMRLAALSLPFAMAMMLGEASSHADMQSAMAGHPWPWPTSDTCITSPAWDMMTNSCNDQVVRLLVIPMQDSGAYNGGSVHVYARAKANPYGTSDTACQAIGVGPDNLAYYFSA